jgi:hypothetical protein
MTPCSLVGGYKAADHSYTSGTDAKNMWSYTSTFPYLSPALLTPEPDIGHAPNPVQTTLLTHLFLATLIVSTHLLLGIQSWCFPAGFPTITLYLHLSSSLHAWPSQPPRPHYSGSLDDLYGSLSSSLCSVLSLLRSSFILGQNIFLSTNISKPCLK